ncbi:MAG: phosphoribosylglycinamide formyltransferase [Cypionkella sp.]|nr:phosphoribosylglycinamide formyltransferase [Cypionkella sp.]
MKRVAILISGGGSNMQALVRDMVGDHPGRAVLVASDNPGATGLAVAAAMGIPVKAVDHRAYDRAGFEAALLEVLVSAAPDVVCLAGFMRVLSANFVHRFKGRMLNIHPSLLPNYPGLHTHARALAAGDKQTGCTVHQVTADLDAGPILGQAAIAIVPGDTVQSLAARVLVQEHRLYPAVLRRFLRGETAVLTL